MTGPIQAVERTASQPTGRVAGVGVRGGWLAFAHFYRYAGRRRDFRASCAAATQNGPCRGVI
jgi:hypothetical protein